jgi:hypothetical protein
MALKILKIIRIASFSVTTLLFLYLVQQSSAANELLLQMQETASYRGIDNEYLIGMIDTARWKGDFSIYVWLVFLMLLISIFFDSRVKNYGKNKSIRQLIRELLWLDKNEK